MVTDITQQALPGFSPREPRPEDRPPTVGHVSVSYKQPREILTRATGFMDGYDFTLNPYSGCSFGCTYCYAAFFSRTRDARDTWGHWVEVKENALELLGWLGSLVDGSGAVGAVRQAMAGLAIEPGRE